MQPSPLPPLPRTAGATPVLLLGLIFLPEFMNIMHAIESDMLGLEALTL